MSKPNKKFSRRDSYRIRRVSWSSVQVWRDYIRYFHGRFDPALAFDYAFGRQGVTMPHAIWRRRAA